MEFCKVKKIMCKSYIIYFDWKVVIVLICKDLCLTLHLLGVCRPGSISQKILGLHSNARQCVENHGSQYTTKDRISSDKTMGISGT